MEGPQFLFIIFNMLEHVHINGSIRLPRRIGS